MLLRVRLFQPRFTRHLCCVHLPLIETAMTPTCTASLTGAQLLLLVLLTGLVGHRSVAQEDDIVEVDPTESMLLDMLENVHVLLEFQE